MKEVHHHDRMEVCNLPSYVSSSHYFGACGLLQSTKSQYRFFLRKSKCMPTTTTTRQGNSHHDLILLPTRQVRAILSERRHERVDVRPAHPAVLQLPQHFSDGETGIEDKKNPITVITLLHPDNGHRVSGSLEVDRRQLSHS